MYYWVAKALALVALAQNMAIQLAACWQKRFARCKFDMHREYGVQTPSLSAKCRESIR